MTDWKTEIETRLTKSFIFKTLETSLNEEGKVVASQQLDLIFKCVDYAYQRSKLILKYMPEYTLHDGEHLFRVLYLMEKIIPKENIGKLSSPELMFLIITSFFHDIGMAPYEYEIRAWNKIWEEDEPNKEEFAEFEKFNRFANTFPEKLDEIEKLNSLGFNQKAQLIHSFLISEYIRTTHALRAREIISKEWGGKILYQDQDLTASFAELCFSHNEDAMKLLNLETDALCGENTYLNLTFIGVILRLADLLDFDAKRTPSVLFSHLTVRNPVSLEEWEKHRSIKAWSIIPNNITYSAVCKHPAIEASVRKFCDLIDDELKNCNVILSKSILDEKYKLELPTQVNRNKIVAEKDIATGEPKYIYHDTSFHLSKNQVIDLLMGTKLYGKPEVALRELLQNSIDACMLSESLHKKWGVPYKPLITVKYYTDDNEDFLEVNDNGIGMNQEIIDKYYSKIGSSYYKSRDFFDLQAKSELEFKPISRFGIGILSCFMVADTMEVETKRLMDQYEFDTPLKITIEGYDSIFTTVKSQKKEPGTSTKLLLRKKINPWHLLKNEEFIFAVKNAIPKPEIPIQIITDKESISYTKADFYNVQAEELKNYYWTKDENIRELKISFKDNGLEGNALIAFIEQNNAPLLRIDKLSEKVEIKGEVFDLSMEIKYDTNEIRKSSTSIGITDNGTIKSSPSYSSLAKSESRLSIHGISYPDSLFPDYYTREKKAMLRWTFPMLIVLDIGGINDLDLNSARNEILHNENWDYVEQKLAYIVCKGIFESVNISYWEELQPLLVGETKSENFQLGLQKIKKEIEQNAQNHLAIK
jgi:molecular chaperone HtpG